jgi:HNH endonuclease
VRKFTPAGDALFYFLAHVNDATDNCIVWIYATNASGHGRMKIDGKGYSVHELACTMRYGRRPPGMSAIHGPCHNPACFNWRHLSWGTHKQNMDDRLRDGSLPRGAKLPQTKLNESQVREIRKRYAAGGISHGQLAIEYGVSRRTITHVVRGTTWGWV